MFTFLAIDIEALLVFVDTPETFANTISATIRVNVGTFTKVLFNHVFGHGSVPLFSL